MKTPQKKFTVPKPKLVEEIDKQAAKNPPVTTGVGYLAWGNTTPEQLKTAITALPENHPGGVAPDKIHACIQTQKTHKLGVGANKALDAIARDVKALRHEISNPEMV